MSPADLQVVPAPRPQARPSVVPSDVAACVWHTLVRDQALERLSSAESGLSEDEATARRAVFGPNVLPRRKRPSVLALYLRQFKNPLVYLLLAATIVSIAAGEWTDALFILHRAAVERRDRRLSGIPGRGQRRGARCAYQERRRGPARRRAAADRRRRARPRRRRASRLRRARAGRPARARSPRIDRRRVAADRRVDAGDQGRGDGARPRGAAGRAPQHALCRHHRALRAVLRRGGDDREVHRGRPHRRGSGARRGGTPAPGHPAGGVQPGHRHRHRGADRPARRGPARPGSAAVDRVSGRRGPGGRRHPGGLAGGDHGGPGDREQAHGAAQRHRTGPARG